MDNNYLLPDLNKILNEVDYGEVNFSVCKHNGKVVNLIANSFKTFKYKNENPMAIAQILHVLKEIADNKQSGSFSFTITFNQGQISKVVNQGYANINYTLKKEDPLTKQ